MIEVTNDEITKISESLKVKSEKCTSIEDFIDVAFNFKFDNHTITPLQLRDEIHWLMKILNKLNPKTLLEIGTSNGGTLFLLCKVSNPTSTVISIDLPDGKFGGEFYPEWKQSFYRTFVSKNQHIHLLRSDSHAQTTLAAVKNILGNKKIDFLMIDGDHSYDGVKQDFELYSSLMADGGMIAFHDINSGPQENVGGVPIFWQEVKKKFTNFEIIQNTENESYGIGLIFVSNSKLDTDSEIRDILLEIRNEQLTKRDLQTRSYLSKIQENPIGLLLSIYAKRSDLQQSFPEVSNGNLNKLIDWAMMISRDDISDERTTRQLLKKFYLWYNENRPYQFTEEKLENLLIRLNDLSNRFQTNIITLEKDRDSMKSRLEQAQLNAIALEKDRDSMKSRLEQAQLNAIALEKERNKLRITLDQVRSNAVVLQKELEVIHNSFSWKILRRIDAMKKNLSFLHEFKLILQASKTTIGNEGFDSFVNHSKAKIKRKELKILSHQTYELPKVGFKSNMLIQEILYTDSMKESKTYEQKFNVSVVIPTNSDILSLMPVIERIECQKGMQQLQIILVNSGNHDLSSLSNTSENIEIIKIDPSQFHHAKTRNLGASNAHGDFLIFLTDDAIPITNHLFYDMCSIISKDEKIGAVTARQIPRSDSDIMYTFLIKTHYDFLGLHKDRIVHTSDFNKLTPVEQRKMAQIDDVCSCYNREIFSQFQYRHIDYAEDLDMGIRLLKNGYKISQLSSTGVIHSHTRPSLYYVKRGFVDNIWLAKLIDQQSSDYVKMGISNFGQIINEGYHLYKSVSLVIDFLKQQCVTDIPEILHLMKNKIPEFYTSDLAAMSKDDSLDFLFSKLSISHEKIHGESSLTIQFLGTLSAFGNYMTNSYPNIRGIESDFYETLYKICGWVIGNTLGGFKEYTERNNIQLDIEDKKIEQIVGSGV